MSAAALAQASETSTLIAEYVTSHRADVDAIRGPAARAFIDTLASAMAGRDEASTRVALAWASQATPAQGAPRAREWVSGRHLLTSEAAFVNGVAGHALDLDDVSMAMWGHPSTLLVPVTVALAEKTSASIGELLAAYAVGLHVDIAVAAGFDLVAHYARGWHASVTIGTIGAVAAGARLLGLDAQRTRNALGLAVSMASGSRQNFGTMTKALHIGLAASNAVRACELAEAGADASSDAIDGPLGFYALYGNGSGRPEEVARSLASPQERSLATLSAKAYPCCYQSHRSIDATVDIRERAGQFTVDDIAEITVHVNPGSDNSLIHDYASTPTQARFCLRYVVAAALLRDTVGFETFTDQQVSDPAIQGLMRRINVEHDETPPYGEVAYSLDYAAVLVRRADGHVEHATCSVPRGNAERPFDDAQLLRKANACFAYAGMRAAAEDLAEALDTQADPATGVVDVLRALDKT